MKLYLAIVTTSTLMEGVSNEVVGVFDSKERATKALTRVPEFKKRVPGTMHYHFDGELSYYFGVQEVTLNKLIN